jgi:NAD+ synthase (glutamine-hydrolysing)
MNITLHQTHHTIADFEGIFEYIKSNFNKETQGIHVFPELFLTGYPLQDLCLQKPFAAKYTAFLAELKNWLKNNLNNDQCFLLLGGIKYLLSDKGVPITIENVIFQFGDGKSLDPIYTKRLLPNYDIFDEKKYFTKGTSLKI